MINQKNILAATISQSKTIPVHSGNTGVATKIEMSNEIYSLKVA